MTHHRLIRTALALAVALTVGQAAFADEGVEGVEAGKEFNRNALTFGFGGGGVLGVTYERTLFRAGPVYANVNAGAGLLFFGGGFAHGATVGLGGTHSVEAGALGTLIAVRSISLGILGPANDELGVTYRVRPLIGYRRQPAGRGLVIRAFFSPYLTNDSALNVDDNTEELRLVPWGGLMFGFSF